VGVNKKSKPPSLHTLPQGEGKSIGKGEYHGTSYRERRDLKTITKKASPESDWASRAYFYL